MSQLVSYLIEKIDLFGDYPMKAVEEIASRMEQKSYSFNDVILYQNEPSINLMILYKGDISLLDT